MNSSASRDARRVARLANCFPGSSVVHSSPWGRIAIVHFQLPKSVGRNLPGLRAYGRERSLKSNLKTRSNPAPNYEYSLGSNTLPISAGIRSSRFQSRTPTMAGLDAITPTVAHHAYDEGAAQEIESLFAHGSMPFRTIRESWSRHHPGRTLDVLTFASMVVNRDWSVTDAECVRPYAQSQEQGNLKNLTRDVF